MKRMLLSLALLAASHTLFAAPWTYRGTLNDGGKPANGRYDLRLTLLNESGTQALIQPISLFDVTVKDGGFSVNVDFGIELSHAESMKLKTEVQQGGSGFDSLGEPTIFNPKAALAGVCWDTEGNAATDPAINFIGTTDAQPLVFRVQNQEVARYEPSGPPFNGAPITANVIAGSEANGITANVRGATIAGGGTPNGDSDPDFTGEGRNSVTDHYGTVSGGFNNQAGDASGPTADRAFATVSGGRSNNARGESSTVAGGQENKAKGTGSSIGGGIGNDALGVAATVGGGTANCAGGDNSWVGGTRANTRAAAVADCGDPSGDADGDNGTFVWADSDNANFVSTGPNQFLVRADGGVAFNANTIGSNDDLVIAARALTGNANVDLRLTSRSGEIGVLGVSDSTGSTFLTTAPNTGENRLNVTSVGVIGSIASLSNGGTWTNASSRSYKENFSTVDAGDVLRRLIALPIMTWDYKGSSEGLHMGPVAEDFKASFGLAGDGKSISTVDADGIALAAIQGLNQKLETENAVLRARLEALEQLMALRAAPSR